MLAIGVFMSVLMALQSSSWWQWASWGCLGFVGTRKMLGWETDREKCVWFFAGMIKEMLVGVVMLAWRRVVSFNKPLHKDWSFLQEVAVVCGQRSSDFVATVTTRDQRNFRFVRKVFEVLNRPSTTKMLEDGYVFIDYMAGYVRCRAVCMKEDEALVRRVVIDNERGAGEDLIFILHHHGGGFCSGTLDASHNVAAHYDFHARERANPLNVVVVIVDYPLAPEERFPAAIIGAVDAFLWHTERESLDEKRIVLAGESAGGGLVKSCLLALRDGLEHHFTITGKWKRHREYRMPACAIIMSPFLNLAHDVKYCEKRAQLDMITPKGAISCAKTYIPDPKVAATHPLANLSVGKFHNLPPMLITSGEMEIFHPHIEKLVQTARKHDPDNTIEFLSYKDQTHSFQLFWETGCKDANHLYTSALDFVSHNVN